MKSEESFGLKRPGELFEIPDFFEDPTSPEYQKYQDAKHQDSIDFFRAAAMRREVLIYAALTKKFSGDA